MTKRIQYFYPTSAPRKSLMDIAEADVSVLEDGRHFIHSFNYKGCKFEPVNGRHLDQFIQTLKHLGIQEGSRLHDYCIFDRGSHINVQVGRACFVFNPDGSYKEVRD